MIVDWDIHQGDGTQDIFYNSDEVLVVSLHRHDRGKFYPFRPDGHNSCVGEGKGAGYQVNIGWNTQETAHLAEDIRTTNEQS